VSYNGSGTFNINTAGQPVVTGTVISSTAFNALTADLGTGLSTAITKDGQTVATARIPFAQGINSSLVTDATSTTTGSIITAGGVGIAKALFVGTTANIAGTTTLAGVTATSITDSGLTSGRVTYAGTAGLLQDSANLTFNGTTLTANTIGAFTLGGTVSGGGNQLNNVIIGTTTPLAGAFTTLSASGATNLATGGVTVSTQIGTLTAPTTNALQHLFNGAAVWMGQTTAGGETDLGWNFYYNSGFKSRVSDVASRLSFNPVSGYVSFFHAPTPGAADAALTFTESMRIQSPTSTTGVIALGTLVAGTTVGVGGVTPSGSGSGVQFPATQSASTDANTLDDYEEGTWTPTQGAGLTVVGAFSSSGRYTKIGRAVNISGRIAGATSIATTAGTVMMGAIPFSVAEASAVGTIANSSLNALGGIGAFGTTAYSLTTIGATSVIDFSLTYSV
jgi:hypothetical protein